MSLYDGLGISDQEHKPKESSDVAGWGKGIKLMQSQLQLRKATLTKHQRDKERAKQSPALGTGSLFSAGDTSEGSKNKGKVGKENSFQSVFKIGQLPHSTASSSDPDSLIFNIKNEYDPHYPNDYEIIKEKQRKEKEKLKEEERKQKQEERERQRKERHERAKERDKEREREREKEREKEGGSSSSRERDRERERGRESRRSRRTSTDSESDRSSDEEDEKKKGKGAAIAPPPSLTRTESPEIPSIGEGGGGAAIPPPPLYNDEELDTLPPPGILKRSTFGFAPGVGANSVAAKIMKKYGFKEGQGLGRMEQGISRALEVEKTSKRGGKILSEKDLIKEEMPPPAFPPPSSQQQTPAGTSSPGQQQQSTGATQALTEIMKNPTKVILLKNMVGPGDVDDDLQLEVTEECGKYGNVVKCLIFEIPEAPEEESVRIFVEFDNLPSAIKAIVDLNGRFFGGRMVNGSFYDVDKFKRLELLD